MIEELFIENFTESINTKQKSLEILQQPVIKGARLLATTFAQGNKLLICGNGGSASDSQHFAAEFTGRYEMERQPLAAIALTTDTSALTAIGNDYGFDLVFAKQVLALGQKNDVLMAISTSGNSTNIIGAITVAQKRGMDIIALVGNGGGKIATMLKDDDICICVPATRTARIQEVHILILHTLCDIVDQIMFKS